ncbi:MAG: hypothetical protein F2667_06360, partial [Actinobacteria bacterium]|nr:hypothetical protein [Actinomycetota bacterium]
MSSYEPPAGPPPTEPPAGGYGAPPPPPPPPADGGYGAPPPAGGYGGPAGPDWDLGAALSYGWAKFQANVSQILLAALALLIAIGVMVGIGIGIQSVLLSGASCSTEDGVFTCDDGSGFFATLIVQALISALILIAAQVVGAGLIRGALGITEGRAFTVSEVFKTDKIVPVLVTSVIIAAATFVGTILCYLPGLVVGFATSYSLFFVIDKNMSPIEAITASVNLVKDNLGPTIV